MVVNSTPVNVAGDVGREAGEDGLGQKDSLKGPRGPPVSTYFVRYVALIL